MQYGVGLISQSGCKPDPGYQYIKTRDYGSLHATHLGCIHARFARFVEILQRACSAPQDLFPPRRPTYTVFLLLLQNLQSDNG